MKRLTDYSDLPATRQVIGSIMLKPEYIKQYNISESDFAEKLYQYVFLAIEQLYNNGAKFIDAAVVVDYLQQYKVQYKNFQHNNGFELLQSIEDTTDIENFEYNINIVKKFALLRDYTAIGIDVGDYFDPEDYEFAEIDKKRKLLEDSSIEDIMGHFKLKQARVNEKYQTNTNVEYKKAGVDGDKMIEMWKHATSWGLGYASAYLNSITYGIRQRRYTIKTAGTGVGKTRTALADICHAFSPKYYDRKLGKWCKNPNGVENKVLYIGTEMELADEIDPILWAYIADVPQDHIQFNLYEDGEEERVKEAIRILSEESFIYLAYCPEFNVEKLENIIETHKLEYGITSVFFDYIMTTGNLIAEYAEHTKARMTVREDQVLSNLSAKIKEMCRKYDVSFDTCTQVSGDWKNIENRDASIVRGSKAVIDKADIAIIALRPTTKELKMIDNILNSHILRGDKKIQCPTPNIVYSVYKNRGGKYVNIKVWLYIEFETMRVHDLFVTDYDYKLIPDFPKTYVDENAEGGVFYNDEKSIYELNAEAFNEGVEELRKNNQLPNYGSVQEIEKELKADCVMTEEPIEEDWIF